MFARLWAEDSRSGSELNRSHWFDADDLNTLDGDESEAESGSEAEWEAEAESGSEAGSRGGALYEEDESDRLPQVGLWVGS